jgi:hypothetical protein
MERGHLARKARFTIPTAMIKRYIDRCTTFASRDARAP